MKLKLESESKYGGAVDVKTLLTALKALSDSYESYVKACFFSDLGQDFQIKDSREIKLLKGDNELLIVDLNFASFEASIAPNTSTYIGTIPYQKGALKWKKNTFDSYKQEVIWSDYNSTEYRKSISKKFNDEAKRKIFKPIFDNILDKDLRLRFESADSKKLIAIQKPTNAELRDEFIPPKLYIAAPSTNEKTYKIYVTTDDSPDLFEDKKIKVKKLHSYEELENPVYPYTPSIIEDEEFRIELLEKLTFEVSFDENEQIFHIDSKELELTAWGQDRPEAEDAFDFMFIESFKSLVLEEDQNLTEDAIEIKKKLKAVVKQHQKLNPEE